MKPRSVRASRSAPPSRSWGAPGQAGTRRRVLLGARRAAERDSIRHGGLSMAVDPCAFLARRGCRPDTALVAGSSCLLARVERVYLCYACALPVLRGQQQRREPMLRLRIDGRPLTDQLPNFRGAGAVHCNVERTP